MNTDESQDKNIIIRRRTGARALRLSVDGQGRVVVSAPRICALGKIQAFVASHQNWIKAQQAEMAKCAFSGDGASIVVLGKALTVRHTDAPHTITHIAGSDLIVGGDPAFLERRVTDFIKKETAAYIHRQASVYAEKIGVSFRGISLKDTVSRWGSCSSKKHLNFCWRLGMAPRYVLDYIIAHEVAHLAEMNHSAAFWRVVACLTDKRADAEIWLRRFGRTLRAL